MIPINCECGFDGDRPVTDDDGGMVRVVCECGIVQWHRVVD